MLYIVPHTTFYTLLYTVPSDYTNAKWLADVDVASEKNLPFLSANWMSVE